MQKLIMKHSERSILLSRMDNDATGEREDIIRSFVEYYKGCTKDFR